MKVFDCLDQDALILGPHILEASAGTGKTFAIEHVFVRLLLSNLDDPIDLEKILVVTFTRASTRELRLRIFEILKRAHFYLKTEDDALSLPYLNGFLGNKKALFILSMAMNSFEKAQIFTIHSFCMRMLKEYGFEAGHFFSSEEKDSREQTQRRQEEMKVFWAEGIDPNLISEAQLSQVLIDFPSVEELELFLMKATSSEGLSLQNSYEKFQDVLKNMSEISIEKEKLIEDFESLKSSYKVVKGNFSLELDFLYQCFQEKTRKPFEDLLKTKGTLFSFFHPENKKVRTKEVNVHYPALFERLSVKCAPIFKEALSKANAKALLVSLWKSWEEKHAELKNAVQPDEMIQNMLDAVSHESFRLNVREKYQALIIDEFQDTDPLQWEIFKKVFIEKDPVLALYLVGDPKQSIYRFRKADVYTYFEAKRYLGEEAHFQLNTNYRSSKDLVQSLNSLFTRDFLRLPQTKECISYTPVKSGSSIVSSFQDGKKSIHFVISDEKASFEETYLPFAVKEIENLKPEKLSSVAILVKDRFELENALILLRRRNISAVGRSNEKITDTLYFQAIREVFLSLEDPFNESKREAVEKGPFRGSEKTSLYWREILEEKGLSSFFTLFAPHERSLEFMQVLEELFSFEIREGFSFEGLFRFLNFLENLDPEEGTKKWAEVSLDAVQVMTMHVSKGLEFDTVFAFSLASKGPKDLDAEVTAEKFRQLYVTMTRAKKRLYVPFKRGSQTNSPMDLFKGIVEEKEGDFENYIKTLSKTDDISFEEIPQNFLLSEELIFQKETTNFEKNSKELESVSFLPRVIQSFSSLSKNHEPFFIDVDPLSTLPRGKETGVLVHKVFETLFSSYQDWTEDRIRDVLEKELKYTPLEEHQKELFEMVQNALTKKIEVKTESFSLRDMKPQDVKAEVEFLYQRDENLIKGFVDLIFIYKNKLYFLDWKTNVLKGKEKKDMEEIIFSQNYDLQARLYKEALLRYFNQVSFGGAIYFFLRANNYILLEGL